MISERYLAGFFDADGYVGVRSWQNGRSYMLGCSITNISTSLLEKIQGDFGGKIHTKSNTDQKHSHEFHIMWNSTYCQDFLQKLYPYSILKKDQIKLALEFPINTTKKRSEILIKKQKQIYEKLKELKKPKRYIPEKYIGIAKREHEEYLKKQKLAKKLHRKKLSYRQIAKEIGVSHVMVANYLRNL